MSSRLSMYICTGILVAAQLGRSQSPDNPMNARDAFWSASDLVDKRPAAAVAPKKNPPKAQQPRPVTPVQTVDVNLSEQAPLGLRYTLLKEINGKYAEVLPDVAFRAGDRVRVSVMANEPSYLYIVQRGASGSWSPLYPQPGMPNKLEPGLQYQFPPEGEFTFDGSVGQDKMFILLTRQPEADLDETILALRHDQDQGAATKMASSKINNLWTQELQPGLGSRDLIFTKVDSDSSAASTSESVEKAMYVVNQKRSASSKIVVELSLNHH